MLSKYSMETTERYIYTALDTTRPSIRLLEILPSKQSECIALSLKHVYLDEWHYQYRTISYTWGSPNNPTHTVAVDDKFLQLRKNIFLFLEQCYETRIFNTRWYWIDSICINQKDTAEKAQQVGMMGDIFRKAYGTLIWLDEVSLRSDLACIYKRCEVRTSTPEEIFGTGIVVQKTLEDILYEESNLDLQQDVFDLLSHSYWGRLWILQEIYVSRRVEVILGRSTLPLHLGTVEALLKLWQQIRQDRVHAPTEASRLETYEDKYRQLTFERIGTEMGQIWRKGACYSLLELIGQYHSHQCEKTVDRVYGLLSLAWGGEDIRIDYECSNLVLFSRCLQHHIKGRKDFGHKDGNIDMHQVRVLIQALCLPRCKQELQELLQTTSGGLRTSLPLLRFKLGMCPNVSYVCGTKPGNNTFLKLIDDDSLRSHRTTRDLWFYCDKEGGDVQDRILAQLMAMTASIGKTVYLKCRLAYARYELVLKLSEEKEISLFAFCATGPNVVTPATPTSDLLILPILPSKVSHRINKQLEEHTDLLLEATTGTVGPFELRCSMEDLLYLSANGL